MDRPRFFNPFEKIQVHGHRLPHWQQPGATYFVTFRLADSLPQERLGDWREEREAWLQKHPKPWDEEVEREYHRTFSRRVDVWLDEGVGSCILSRPELASEVSAVLHRFHDDRYFLHSFVIMPNHVHVLASLSSEASLEKELQGRKGVSSRRINQILNQSGAIWQKNYFDRMIRNEDHFFRVARYIRENPSKGRVSEGHFLLWESIAVKEMLEQ